MSDLIVPVDYVDTDADGYAETAIADADGDGYIDTVLTDVIGDGHQATVLTGSDAAPFPVDPTV